MTLQEHLDSIGACKEARIWAGMRTARQAWEECNRADHLLWWAVKTDANPLSQVRLAACKCARRALRFVSLGNNRPHLAIEAAEQCAADPNNENRQKALLAGVSAWSVAAWERSDPARHASHAAAWAGEAARRTNYVAVAVAAVAEEVADAAGRSRAAEHKEMCLIIRSMLVQPWQESIALEEING